MPVVGLEERERLEHLVVKHFKNDAKGHKERLMQGHRVRGMLEQLQRQAAKSVSLLPSAIRELPCETVHRFKSPSINHVPDLQVKVFEDADGIRREEIAALRGQDVYRCVIKNSTCSLTHCIYQSSEIRCTSFTASDTF